jgi:hypothetical protein
VQGLDHVLLGKAFAVFLIANAVVTWMRAGRRKGGARLEVGRDTRDARPS